MKMRMGMVCPATWVYSPRPGRRVGAGGKGRHEQSIMEERKGQPWGQETRLLTLDPSPADLVGP